jgi:hypothetical protein
MHILVSKCADVFSEPPFVNRADLLKQHDGITVKTVCCAHYAMGGESVLHALACNSGNDDRGAVSVSHVILDYQDRANAALLATDDGV